MFKAGDTVLVSGATITKNGVKAVHRSLAKIVVVGKYDICVSPTPKNDYDRAYRIPKSRCQKISLSDQNFNDEITKPKIGNLVASYVSYMGKKEQKIGSLKEIIDKPGSTKIAIISSSSQNLSVPYDSLIVLED